MKARVSLFSALFALTTLTVNAQEDERTWDSPEVLQAMEEADRPTVTAPAQSTEAENPGSSVYAFSTFTVTDITSADGKKIRIWVPVGLMDKRPLVAFGPGKQLGNPTNYQALHEHLAKKGLIVAHIQFEGSFFDTDFVKFGRWFNNAVAKVVGTVSAVDTAQIYYCGHSLGAQVAVIAAGHATGANTGDTIINPKGLILMSYDNSRGPTNGGDLNNPACGYAVKVDSAVQACILEFEDDTIAGPSKKTYASALYNKLPCLKKQWVRVRGKNLGSIYALTADHNTPMTAGSAPMGIGGASKLNALDWYMTFKIMAGIPLVNAGIAPSTSEFVYGSRLVDGGTASNGVTLLHQLMNQSF